MAAAGPALGTTLHIKQLDVCDEGSIRACVDSIPGRHIDVLGEPRTPLPPRHRVPCAPHALGTVRAMQVPCWGPLCQGVPMPGISCTGKALTPCTRDPHSGDVLHQGPPFWGHPASGTPILGMSCTSDPHSGDILHQEPPFWGCPSPETLCALGTPRARSPHCPRSVHAKHVPCSGGDAPCQRPPVPGPSCTRDPQCTGDVLCWVPGTPPNPEHPILGTLWALRTLQAQGTGTPLAQGMPQ